MVGGTVLHMGFRTVLCCSSASCM